MNVCNTGSFQLCPRYNKHWLEGERHSILASATSLNVNLALVKAWCL